MIKNKIIYNNIDHLKFNQKVLRFVVHPHQDKIKGIKAIISNQFLISSLHRAIIQKIIINF